MIQLQDHTTTTGRSQRLGFKQIRHFVEALRQGRTGSEEGFAVIAIFCTPTATRGVERIVSELDDLDELLKANWAHEKQMGWLSPDSLVIVLPNAAPLEAWQYRDQIRAYCGFPDEAINVYVGDQTIVNTAAGHDVIYLPSIDELLIEPAPGWKRGFDVMGALLGLAFAAPLLLLSALVIKLTSRGPILFRQLRVGLGGQPFSMYKLRTMREDADQIKDDLRIHNESDGLGFKITDDPRMTAIGRILRKSSLDELPQLFNVLRGEMSLVGPRPLPCSDWQPTDLWVCRRHDVKPGDHLHLASPRSVARLFEEWMHMDICYIESQNFFSDLKLLLKTVPAVVTQRGAS